jgi:hypothetical protein
MKPEGNIVPTHKDPLGEVFCVDDFVAFSVSNRLRFGMVTKINPKMLRVKIISPRYDYEYNYEYNRYPFDCVKLCAPNMTSYILKNSGRV